MVFKQLCESILNFATPIYNEIYHPAGSKVLLLNFLQKRGGTFHRI